MVLVRKPVVAGAFYPDNPTVLQQQLQKIVAAAPIWENKPPVKAVIVPHAGYMYSGKTAAIAFKALSSHPFSRAVVIAPSHRVGGFAFALGDYDFYQTPLGRVPIDKDFCQELLALGDFEARPDAHQAEHSLEVQLPFLQMINPNVKLVPIILGAQNERNSYALANSLADMIKKYPDTALIVSSDLSHYHTQQEAQELDEVLIKDIINRDAPSLSSNIDNHRAEACGFGGISTLLHMAANLGWTPQILEYSNSGDVSKDYSSVVGYLSVAFSG